MDGTAEADREECASLLGAFSVRELHKLVNLTLLSYYVVIAALKIGKTVNLLSYILPSPV
jgi:hypothetical protein